MAAWGICLVLAINGGGINATAGFLLTKSLDKIENKVCMALSESAEWIKDSISAPERSVRFSSAEA